MNIVIPMAGAGSRFSKAGFKIAKPLIEVKGKPMYQWATNSLPLEHASRLIFVLREDAFTDQLVDDIRSTYCMFEPRIKILECLSRGQAETVYQARDLLDLKQPTLIHNTDSAFESMSMPDSNAFGGMVVFEPAPNDARWHFIKTDEQRPDRIVDIQDKKIISRVASTGTYYFADSAWLMYSIKHALLNNLTHQDEYCIAPLYNRAIDEGHYIQQLGCKNFTCLNTPEELVAALPHMPLPIATQITQIAV